LSSARNGAERIALDREDRRIGRQRVAAPGADLLGQRLADAGVQRIRRLRHVGEL
jgi:hypothetical protein